MPKKKRSRKHKKIHNSRNHFSNSNLPYNATEPEDIQLRECSEDTSLNASTSMYNAEAFNLKTGFKTSSPKVILTDLRLRADSYISDLKRNASRERSPNYSELRYLFNCSPKLHSPDLLANIGTRTSKDDNQAISETPRISHDKLLDLDYEVERICTPVSGYKTPLKRMRPNNITPIYDMKDSAIRIQDLNNLQNEKSEEPKIQNCSRALNTDSLKRLQNFNELILNTSQSIDYDNCEVSDVTEDEVVDNPNVMETSGTEISFFTPQLYNGKSASTPIEKHKAKSESVEPDKIPNKIEIIKSKPNISTSTQVEMALQHNIGVQTNAPSTPSPSKPKHKEKVLSVTKRRTYKSLTPTVVVYKTPLRAQMVRAIPTHERSTSINSITAIEVCTRIFSKIKKYHGRYSSKLPGKLFELCIWLGFTIRKGFSSLYKLTAQNSARNCPDYVTQIAALTASIDNLRLEITHMKQETQASTATTSTELEQIRRELHQFEDIKKELHEIKERLTTRSFMPMFGAPPPPPPPPPPPSLASVTPLNTKPKSQQQKKKTESARPIISLDDILKVKLRKIGDRPTPTRRATEPLVSSAFRLKLKPGRTRTPSTGSPASSLSNSPHSSLTRLLTSGDINVCRVKRLHRKNAYSFDDFSRKGLLGKREST